MEQRTETENRLDELHMRLVLVETTLNKLIQWAGADTGDRTGFIKSLMASVIADLRRGVAQASEEGAHLGRLTIELAQRTERRMLAAQVANPGPETKQ